ncbi:hypothetical protein GKJPGBOP_00899 [Streptomyces paromomycinus]|uniref:Uncharacterized protein n=1 Tax=Streptomyces paromomycinus TaxID=92743 RepID=A0A401VW18_STREY|nr:hypothetical protein GKJPGBOP_00899 [Streptomyces paromomycinus]
MGLRAPDRLADATGLALGPVLVLPDTDADTYAYADADQAAHRHSYAVPHAHADFPHAHTVPSAVQPPHTLPLPVAPAAPVTCSFRSRADARTVPFRTRRIRGSPGAAGRPAHVAGSHTDHDAVGGAAPHVRPVRP